MAANLRRMVVLGPAGCIYPGSTQDLRVAGNRSFFSDTRTRWVRMWADWPTLQPTAAGTDPTVLAALDAQIAQAKRDGLKVILTLYRFPTWANGTGAMTPEQLAATMPDRRTAAQADTKAKSLLFRYPDDLSATSAWGRFVDLLLSRYSAGNPARPAAGTTIDALEVCNEPNLQWWPQMGPSTTGDPFGAGPIVVHDAVARMFVTAQGITARYGSQPLLAGPGCADQVDTNRIKTGYASLATRLLSTLNAQGFVAGPAFVFTHHNYTDVTYDQGAGSTAPDAATNPTRATNRAADMRRRLVGQWAGWPNGNAANPGLWLTEGGVTSASLAANWAIADAAGQRAKAADLVRRNWNRMYNGPDGAGVAMTANYLWYTDPNFDSGLCDTLENGGAKRPAYATWRGLPSFS